MIFSNAAILRSFVLAIILSILVVWKCHRDLVPGDDPDVNAIGFRGLALDTIPPNSKTVDAESDSGPITKSSSSRQERSKENEAILSNADMGLTNDRAKSELPVALQFDPSTVPNSFMNNTMASEHCCTHLLKRRRHQNKNPSREACTGICYTPIACNNPYYPFQSISEREQFFPKKKSKSTQISSKCLEPKPLAPPVNWNTSLDFPFSNLPPLGCSKFTGNGGSGAFQTLYIIPSAKLAFCGIPKVGITAWKQFIRYVMGAHDYPAEPHYKMDLNMWAFDRLDAKIQKAIWNDKEWTFAAIIRNPAERLLSAYLDKLKIDDGANGSSRSGSVGKAMNLTRDFSFEDFLERLEQIPPDNLNCRSKNPHGSLHGINWCSDPHWRPQIWNCGMSEKIDRFDFIGTLDHIEDHTKALLDRVGLWESHGKHYRLGKSERTKDLHQCLTLFPLQDEVHRIPEHLRHVGFQQKRNYYNETIESSNISAVKGTKNSIEESSNSTSGKSTGKGSSSWDVMGHARGAGRKISEYYTPELLKKVQEKLYLEDYQVWNLIHNINGDWISGKDILPQLLLARSNNKNNKDLTVLNR